jgi:hypothetical protein
MVMVLSTNNYGFPGRCLPSSGVEDLAMEYLDARESGDYNRDFSALVTTIENGEHNGRKQALKDEFHRLLGLDIKPNSIRSSLKNQVRVLLYLQEIGVKDHGDLESFVSDHPKILTFTKGHLEKRGRYLQRLGINDPERMKKVIGKHWIILTYDLERMRDVKRQLGIRNIKGRDFTKVVERHPQIFSIDVQNNLIPTLDFYFRAFEATPQDIVNNPSIIGYSLENRVIPRYNFLLAHRPKVLKETALSTIIKSPDSKFVEMLARKTLKEYQIYLRLWERGIIPRIVPGQPTVVTKRTRKRT